ncbi:MAG: hypothetical protein R3D01_03215 [Hyphomicrobiales bacterium]
MLATPLAVLWKPKAEAPSPASLNVPKAEALLTAVLLVPKAEAPEPVAML